MSKNNRNQVVKRFLVENGVDVDRFRYHKKLDENDISVRRQKLKLEGSNVSVPTEPSIASTVKELYEDIKKGKYQIGEEVAPIKFKKCSSVDGKLVWEEFVLEARKTPLRVIRKNLYNSHRHLYRTKNDLEVANMNDEECVEYLKFISEKSKHESLQEDVKYFQRRRNLAVWHDCSTISNHEHILFTCAELYDKAIHWPYLY